MTLISRAADFFRKNASFLLFIILLFAFRWSFADQYHVPSGSMEPTIHVGDRILVNKMAYNLKIPFTQFVVQKMAEPQRGDIVVFESPEETGLTLVKRVIGLPGDRIEIVDGFVTINGVELAGNKIGIDGVQTLADEIYYPEQIGERLVNIKRLPLRIQKQNLKFEVPREAYFMMGDNRDNSLDSRAWGFAARANLKGKALRVLWNFSVTEFTPKIELGRIGKVF